MDKLKIAGLCGILSPIIALIFIGLAISQAPWFSWSENCLSNLGGLAGETPVWAAKGVPSILFNTGLIISGALAVLFAISFFKSNQLKTMPGRVGSILLILGTISLILIGAFPGSVGDLHYFVSVAFFVLSPLSVLIIGLVLRKSDRDIGWLAIILGVIGFYAISIPLTGTNCAGNETVAIIPMALFVAVFGLRMFRQ